MVSSKTRKKRPLKISLSLVATVLISSALLRFSSDAGQAMARNIEEDEAIKTSNEINEFTIIEDEGLRRMMISLQERKAKLDRREEMINERLKTLEAVDAEVTNKLQEITNTEEQLRQMLTIADKAAEEDILRLTQVYENMKPKEAAKLFEEMDPNFAAGFLGRMRPDAAAAIMAGLTAEAANLYSVILAGRNAVVPNE